MKKTITCPVCGESNLETNKTCKNKMCKWDLIYAKDGAYVELSHNETNQYNSKLSNAKNAYKIKLSEEEKMSKSILEEKQKSSSEGLLTDVKINQFESIKEFNHRLKDMGYVQIGTYKLLDYNADKEQYNIKITITKSPTQTLDFDFTKLTTLKVSKIEASKIGVGKEFPLLATLHLGLKAQVVDKVHIANRKLKGNLEYMVDKIELDRNAFKIEKLKFDIFNISIAENEILSFIKKHPLETAIIIGLGWIGI